MNYITALIKPASSLCNMRCKYCFYCDVVSYRDIASHGIMSRNTSEKVIDRVLASATPPAIVSFMFQGGEPTLSGISYFEHFTSYAATHAKKGVQIHYAMQTNGLLIDNKWCELFKKYRFLLGISLDSDAENHDYYRLDANNEGTHAQIMQNIKLLQHYNVDFNIVAVLTAKMAKKPKQTFDFMRAQGFDYLQFIPCLGDLDDPLSEHALSPRDYADFLTELFGLYYRHWVRTNQIVSIRQFDNLLTMAKGYPPEQCGMSGRCTPQLVIEADGSVYPCDFYVLDKYKCGNIHTHSLPKLANSANVREFLQDRAERNPMCQTCPVFALCRGGCSRYHSLYWQEPGYCAQQDFLLRIQKQFVKMLNSL